MNRIYFSIIFLLSLVINIELLGQAVAKPIDPIPLEKPAYFSLITINRQKPEKALYAIRDSLKVHGYINITVDIREQVVGAEKIDKDDDRNYCKVIIWFERDFQDPENLIKVFALFGRFEYMLARTSGSFRVILSKELDEKYFGKLKESIRSISILNQ